MIVRDPAAAAGPSYDLIVIGGGAYGVMLTLEAARRGLRPLLLERGDFGGGTSWNSLRIAHGGLRYLQTLDLVRFRDSVSERRWYLRTFPEWVRPLPCLMPLYNRGLKRPAVLRLALRANDWLSAHRNDGVRPDRQLPAGAILTPAQVSARSAAVPREQLEGGALWYDAAFTSSERVLIESLRWACAEGAVALNYVEVTRVAAHGGRVVGVEARDRVANGEHEFRAERVVNCTGPGVRAVGRQVDRDLPALFRPSLAFNLLLDRAPLFEGGLAVQPRRGGRIYFIVPWLGRVLAGTYHAGLRGEISDPASAAQPHLDTMLHDLNDAVPGWGLSRAVVLRVLAGILPAARQGSSELAKRPVVHDHARAGGPTGLVSVSGVKLTTARRVAEQALERLLPGSDSRPISVAPRPVPTMVPSAAQFRTLLQQDPAAARAVAAAITRDEAAVRLDDLLLRRTDWGVLPDPGGALAEQLADVGGLASRALS
jgi:glycerol-3-phosphate dehydrogenase